MIDHMIVVLYMYVTWQGISFLEVKYQLMLSYMIDLMYAMLQKSHDRSHDCRIICHMAGYQFPGSEVPADVELHGRPDIHDASEVAGPVN